MKNFLLFFAVIYSTILSGGVNLLVNPSWQGNPLRPWRGERYTISNGVATISAKGGNGSLWQPFEKAQAGKVYRFTAEVRSDGANEFRFAGYWPAKENGKTVSKASDNWQWIKAGKEWETIETIIKYSKDPVRCPYASLTVRKGSVETRNWKIEEVTGNELRFLTANLLVNPTLKGNPPHPWRGNGFEIRKDFAVITVANGKLSSLWQPFTTAKGGKRYLLSAELRSDGENEFRFCGYWPARVNGKQVSQCSDNWKWLKVGTAWHRFETIIDFPENAIRYPYISLAVRKGSVEVRNWMLEELPPEEKATPSLGGEWKLHRSSRLGTEKDAPGVKNPEITGISIHVPGAELNNIKLTPGKFYQLNFEVVGKGESGTTTGFHGYRLEFMDANGKSLYRVPWQDVWNQLWQKKSIKMDFIPQNTSKIALRLYASTKGHVAFRNFQLTEYTPDPFEKYGIVLTTPGYRNAIYASMPVKSIAGMITSDGRVSSGKITLADGNKILAEAKFGADGKFTIPFVPAAAGEYLLTADTFDKNGKLLKKLTTELYRYDKAPHEFIQGKNRNFYMDGKVVLPILFMSTPGDEDCLKASAAAGFTGYINLAGSESTAWNALERARNCNQKIILGVRYCEDGNIEAWKKRVAAMLSSRVTSHPALLGYFLADEPLWVGANINWFTASAKFLRQHDPFHPVWMNSAPLSSIKENRPYCDAVDINGIDIYPIPYPSNHSSLDDKYPTAVGKYTKTMYETTYGRKSIWMVLQGTSWHEMGGNRKGYYPTLSELRFMNYDAVFSGSNGLVYWGTQYTKSPQFFRDLRKSVNEVYLLAPALLEGRRTMLAAPAGARIFKVEYQNKNYFIVFNDTPKEQNFTFDLKQGGEFAVLFENRNISAVNGKLTDRFIPFACHWYSMDELPETPELPKYTFAEDPFDKLCRLRTTGRKKFVSSASWIWDKSTCKAQGSSAWLEKHFTLGKVPVNAKILVGSDDSCKVYINGKYAGSHHTWNLIKSIDIAKFLKPGENIISVNVSDSGHLPCGFIAEIQYTGADGKTVKIVTDKTWLGAPEKDGSYQPVEILAPLGQGAWANKVYLAE